MPKGKLAIYFNDDVASYVAENLNGTGESWLFVGDTVEAQIASMLGFSRFLQSKSALDAVEKFLELAESDSYQVANVLFYETNELLFAGEVLISAEGVVDAGGTALMDVISQAGEFLLEAIALV